MPPRAPLPEGAANYVTSRGLELLRAELVTLEAERTALAAGDERARRVLAARSAELTARIASAQLVSVPPKPWSIVRFGASVGLRVWSAAGGEEALRYAIVGVDEADAAAGRIAYTAPLARAILGRRSGESVELETPQGAETIEIVDIEY